MDREIITYRVIADNEPGDAPVSSCRKHIALLCGGQVRMHGKDSLTKAMLRVAFLSLALLFVSCGKEQEPDIVTRVLLVYLGGDNSLSGESNEKLEAIKQGYDGRYGTKVLVYHDMRNSAPRLLEISGNTTAVPLREYEAENSADPTVFRRVVAEAKAMYPGAVFNLLVFSHASGWLPAGMLINPRSAVQPRSVITDGSNEMELVDFAGAIPDGAFRHIIFETCFMAGVEVAYQLRDKAEYVLASSAEIVSPGFTDIYRQHTNELVYGDPVKFIQAAFDYFDKQEGYMRSATFSVIKTDALDVLADYIRKNCNSEKEINAMDIQHFDRSSYRLFSDFGEYYTGLLETEMQKEYLLRLIGGCVVWKASTPSFMDGYNGFTIRKHSGMTAYIVQERFPALNEAYRRLDWYKAITVDKE
ncbi:clostripain-related cysteine peptidase [Dysgonomonas termitidis]|uniref:Clostripain-related cysteine peptidase n=1 Tax=Dysgonomonas termitidis TaxID=1516126 RepID=A0ABV9KSU9_9BACT